MVRALSVLSFLATLTLLAAPAVAQGSDSCATPQAISGPGPFAFDTTSATTGSQGQSNGVCNINGSTAIENDVWFTWTASATGTAIVSFCQQTTVDTKVAIYAATSCTAAAPVACDDDGCASQSLLLLTTAPGQVFLIQVGNAPFASPGTGTFVILMEPLATNDDCSTPTAIAGTGLFAFDTRLAATGGPGHGNPGCTNIGSDIWFAWTAPVSGMARFETCGRTGIDSDIAVYAGTGCPVSTSLACDDDACGLQSLVQWPVTSGSPYMLQIGSSGGSVTGYGTFLLDLTPVPANDDCNSPQVVTGSVSWDNTTASTGAQGQSNPCGGIDADLWFQWTASVNGTTTIDTCFQTSVDTSLAVYGGAGCPTGTAMVCNDDGCGGQQSSVTFPVTIGGIYTIQIGSKQGSPPGPASFSLVETAGGGPSTPYCFGDATGAACPCSNNGSPGHGCTNSFHAAGAILSSTGGATVAADTLVLRGAGMPPGTTVIYLQGSLQLNGGLGLPLGDGLRCVSGTLIRLGVKMNSGTGGSSYGGPSGDIPVSIRGGVPGGGGTRDYQAWYRDPPTFCTSATYNLSNGLEIVWAP